MDNKSPINKELLFVAIVILFSVVNIYEVRFSSMSTLLSILGLIGALLWFLKKKGYMVMFNIWVFAQLLIITRDNIDISNGIVYKEGIFDLSQWFNYAVGMQFGDDSHVTYIQINIVAIAFWISMRTLLKRSN